MEETVEPRQWRTFWVPDVGGYRGGGEGPEASHFDCSDRGHEVVGVSMTLRRS